MLPWRTLVADRALRGICTLAHLVRGKQHTVATKGGEKNVRHYLLIWRLRNGGISLIFPGNRQASGIGRGGGWLKGGVWWRTSS